MASLVDGQNSPHSERSVASRFLPVPAAVIGGALHRPQTSPASAAASSTHAPEPARSIACVTPRAGNSEVGRVPHDFPRAKHEHLG
jgi:hypothetical protein